LETSIPLTSDVASLIALRSTHILVNETVHSLSVQGNNDILSTSKCWKRYIDYQLSNM